MIMERAAFFQHLTMLEGFSLLGAAFSAIIPGTVVVLSALQNGMLGGMEQPRFEKKPQKPTLGGMSWREMSQLPKEERDRLIANTGQEILNFFRENAVEYTDVSNMYDVLRGQQMIVRRESPEKLLETIGENVPLHIDFPAGERYSNAVIWNPEQGVRGLDNAYLEGYGASNGVVSIVGFKQGAISDVVAVEDASQRFAGLDRAYVRSVRGDVAPNDILFVSIRIPAFVFPQKDMTEQELERYEAWEEERAQGKDATPQFIHRGFLFTKNLGKQ